jgi:7-cyano-7-deazaguanine reductase
MPEFKVLGKSGATFQGLETFPKTDLDPATVTFETDGPTLLANCPVTGQPDYYHIQISYDPFMKYLESKSLKLYLETFRDEKIFAESLCTKILKDLQGALEPKFLAVEITQNIRGGLKLIVRRTYTPYSSEGVPA